LVCLLLPKSSNQEEFSLYFGVVILRDEAALSENANYTEIGINFTDPSIYSVVESTSVYLESYYHILKSLQTMNPFAFPFEKYFAPNIQDLDRKRKSKQSFYDNDDDNVNKVDPSMYTRAPGFRFDLSVLLEKKNLKLQLNVTNTSTHDLVAQYINKYGKLDQTQGNQ